MVYVCCGVCVFCGVYVDIIYWEDEDTINLDMRNTTMHPRTSTDSASLSGWSLLGHFLHCIFFCPLSFNWSILGSATASTYTRNDNAATNR